MSDPLHDSLDALTRYFVDEAFEERRRQSQHDNFKLRDIAGEIVKRASAADAVRSVTVQHSSGP